MSDGWIISGLFIVTVALILWLVIGKIKDEDDDF
jgi:hypothetical protein